MGSENGAYLSTSPQILPVLGLYLSHLTGGSLSLNRLTTPSSNLCSCRPRLSAFLQLPQSPTVAILTQAVRKKCAHPRTHYDARVVEIQGRPEIFHNCLLKHRSPAALFPELQRIYTPSTISVPWRFAKICQRMRAGKFGDFSGTHHGYQGNMFQARNGQPYSGSGFQKNYQVCSRTHLPPCLHF